MGTIIKNVQIPLDEDGFLRRECPFCMREFKIQLGEKDIQTVEDEVAQPFLLEPSLEDQATTEAMADATEYFCPYCGQVADSDSWWTQEQLSYAHVAAKNIATEPTSLPRTWLPR